MSPVALITEKIINWPVVMQDAKKKRAMKFTETQVNQLLSQSLAEVAAISVVASSPWSLAAKSDSRSSRGRTSG